jgi:hypothetical protein
MVVQGGDMGGWLASTITDRQDPEGASPHWQELVSARKTCRICIETAPGRLRSCAEFDFDPDVVSLWEQWLGHKDPKLLLVGQDFGNVHYFVRNRGRDEPHNKTNDNLHRLLAEAGICAKVPPDPDPDTPAFLTNSILCIKEGAMNAALRASWVKTCTERHLVPLLNHLKPPVVVGMGNWGWRAVRQALGLASAPALILLAAGGSWRSANGAFVFAVGHCGPLGIVNRPWPLQVADWQRIGEAVATVAR